jgi:hypothetical protein
MKSDCTEYQKQIARLLLGDLTPEEQKSLKEHLSVCSVCASEKERYAGTVNLLESMEDEPAPRHFFVQPREMDSNPWKLFLQLKWSWQVATAVCATIVFLVGFAAISDLEVRADAGGWAVRFGSNADVAALRADLMNTIVERDEASAARVAGIREDIGGVLSDMASRDQTMLAALVRQDALLDQRISLTEDRLKEENRELVLGVYDTVTKQRVQDLGIIGLRLDTFENSYAIKERRTDELLSALLQETNREPR